MEPGQEIIFDVRTPIDDEGLRANVRHALSLRLPELRDFEYPMQEALDIVASGPSARRFPFAVGGTAMALNGALRFLLSSGLQHPAYWAGCDPQEAMTDFLAETPPDVTYLVASKCHPSVFDILLSRSCNVVLWHVHEDATRDLLEYLPRIGSCVSITNCAFELGAALGFRSFHTWGWDGCYMDGKDHVLPQPHNGSDVNLIMDEWTFASTTSWALEAQDALGRMIGFPFPVHVHGGGFFGEFLRERLPWRVTADAVHEDS